MLPQNAARQEQLQNLPAILGELRRLAHRQRPWPRQLDVNNTVDATGSWRHDDDAIGQEHGFGDAVGDEQHGRVPFAHQRLEIEHELVPGQGIERAERLVHEEVIGIVNERAADRDALAHAARKLVRISGLEAAEPHRCQEFAGARFRFFAVHLARFRLQHDIAERGAPVEQDGALKDDADVGARPFDFAAGDQYGAARRREQAGCDHQQRALAATARADMGHEFTALLGEGNIAERAHLAVARRINLGQILDPQVRLIVVAGGVHAKAAAQLCCGGTYSAPVGTKSLVKS